MLIPATTYALHSLNGTVNDSLAGLYHKLVLQLRSMHLWPDRYD